MKPPQTNPLKPKKYRQYKGKDIERDETDRERLERLHPGYDELKKVSIGTIGEDGDIDADCLVDDELSDDDFENDDDCLIPLKWADLATGDPETRKMMRQTIKESHRSVSKTLNESKKKTKSKKKKANCSPGNPYHDEDGEFTDSGVKGSWSIPNPDNESDCDYGKLKTTGRGKGKQWTKQPCGRKNPDTPNVKAKYRCKDGKVVSENELLKRKDAERMQPSTSKQVPYSDNPDLHDKLHSDLTDRLQKLLDRDPFFIKHLTYLITPMLKLERETDRDLQEKKRRSSKPTMNRNEAIKFCRGYGLFGWTEFLMKLSAIEKAKKGTINQGPKN